MILIRIAALAEILTVFAAGNILGEALFPLVVSESVLYVTASESSLAFASGLLILCASHRKPAQSRHLI